MIKFGKLIIKGFCSIQDYEIDLDGGHITIIRGENGVGKTTLLSAITWVLYNKTAKEDAKDVNTWKERRPKDYRGTSVEIYWNNGTTLHQVIRCSNYGEKVHGSKGANRLIYLIEGVEVKNKRKDEIQALIEANLTLSYSLFKNSIMFGQGLKRLIQESGTEKRKLFEEVFDVSYLSVVRTVAQKERDKIKEELSLITNPLNTMRASYETNKETYLELKARESNQATAIGEELEEYITQLKEIKRTLRRYDPEIEKSLAKATEKKVRLKEQLEELRENYNSNKKKVSDVTSVKGLGSLVKEIIGLIIINPHLAISKLKELESAIVEMNNYHDEYERLNNKLISIRDEENEWHNIVEKNKKNLEIANTIEKKIDIIKNAKLEVLSPKYKEKYLKYKEEIRVLEKKLLPIEKQLNDYNWVIDDPLGSNGIKSYIFESSMDGINDILMQYADTLGLRIEFGVDLSNTRKDFYTLVEIGGIVVDYADLSGGQKQLVNLAMAFAMWESTSSTKDINILFLDEVFESLSRSNIEIVVDLIKQLSKGKSIYIITHQENLPLSNAKILNLDSKNGLTTFN